MTLSPEILTAIKASCASKAKIVVEDGKLAPVSESATKGHEFSGHVPTRAQYYAGPLGQRSNHVHDVLTKHGFVPDSEKYLWTHPEGATVTTEVGKKLTRVTASGLTKERARFLHAALHTGIVNSGSAGLNHIMHESKLAVAEYFKWLADAPANESSELEAALADPEFMREAVKTRESTALCLTLARKGEEIPGGLQIEAAIEARAFGFKRDFKVVQEALQAMQQVPTRFGYLILSALAENDALRKNFLDLEIKESVALFYFTKPVAADKLKEEAPKALAQFGAVETIVCAGDAIGEGITSDVFVFAVTPTADQLESVMGVLIDGLVEAAIADTFEDVGDEALEGLVQEAIQFMNQTPPNGEVIGGAKGAHAEPDGDEDEDEEGEEPEAKVSDEKDEIGEAKGHKKWHPMFTIKGSHEGVNCPYMGAPWHCFTAAPGVDVAEHPDGGAHSLIISSHASAEHREKAAALAKEHGFGKVHDHEGEQVWEKPHTGSWTAAAKPFVHALKDKLAYTGVISPYPAV